LEALFGDRPFVRRFFEVEDSFFCFLSLRSSFRIQMRPALRVSEVLALKWYDPDFTDQLIQVRRPMSNAIGRPKSKASKAPVPVHPLLAANLLPWREETLNSRAEDFAFPSFRTGYIGNTFGPKAFSSVPTQASPDRSMVSHNP
jgi:integrase